MDNRLRFLYHRLPYERSEDTEGNARRREGRLRISYERVHLGKSGCTLDVSSDMEGKISTEVVESHCQEKLLSR